MNNHITLRDVIDRLNENDMPYEILTLQGDKKIVVTQYGGRVLGPFIGGGESLSWINSVFANAERFRVLMQEKGWNLGGDRFWVAPEHPIFVKERKAFYDSYTVPKALDPGNYKLLKKNDAVELDQIVKIKIYESSVNSKEFRISRRITPLKNPLVGLKEIETLNLNFFGYEHEFILEELSVHGGLCLEPWNLLQVNPNGKIIIPYTGDFAAVDYYEPIGDKSLVVHEGYAELTMDGTTRYKIAFYALNTLGRAVYINKNEDGYYLIYKQYYNDAANLYCCDPWDQPGKKGCSLSIYNDNGTNGGYAEFENSGLTIGEGTNRSRSTTYLAHMFFTGNKEDLEKLIVVLLGVNYSISLLPIK